MLKPLLTKISSYFRNHRESCIKNILILSLAILTEETICLHRLKSAIGGITDRESTQPNSHYKRLIRIFDHHAFSCLWLDLLKYVFILLRFKSDYLLLDGTSWKHGQRWFHYMTLCVVYQGVAIPIFWLDLHKHGISNFKERKKLLKKAMRHFNLADKTLIADREYIGKEWFNLLIESGLDFVIRSKKKTYKEAINQAQGRSYDQMIRKVLASKVIGKAIRKAFMLDGMSLFFVVIKNPKNDPKEPVIFLITNLDQAAPIISAKYPIRWKIEHCFKHLKSNGFELEQINLEKDARRKLLMAVMVFAYVLSIIEGLKEYSRVKFKNYRDTPPYKEESLFRFGINQIAKFTRSLQRFCQYLVQEIQSAQSRFRSQVILNV